MPIYTEEQKQVLMNLINESNPGLNLAPIKDTNTRFASPYQRTPKGDEIADTSLEVYPRDETFFIGKVIVHYRRIDVARLFRHRPMVFERWREDYLYPEDIAQWLNTTYGTAFVPSDFDFSRIGDTNTSSTRVTIHANSLCYQGSFQLNWDKDNIKRALDQIIEDGEIGTLRWDARHEGADDARPLLTLMGYGADYTDFEDTLDRIPNNSTLDRDQTFFRTVLDRFNRLYETDFSVTQPHTEYKGLGGLTVSRYTLPDINVPEANVEAFEKVVVVSSQDSSWFGGRLLFHYNRKPRSQ